ncbi:MAG: hypothetical protein PUE01_08895 [Clostridiaceae bacterium]|nr:hypothetical protein [Clostridiaceae bacterium]
MYTYGNKLSILSELNELIIREGNEYRKCIEKIVKQLGYSSNLKIYINYNEFNMKLYEHENDEPYYERVMCNNVVLQCEKDGRRGFIIQSRSGKKRNII